MNVVPMRRAGAAKSAVTEATPPPPSPPTGEPLFAQVMLRYGFHLAAMRAHQVNQRNGDAA